VAPVVPGWRRRKARTRKESTSNSPSLISVMVSAAATAVSGTGKTIGSICARRMFASGTPSWAAPKMHTAVPLTLSGLKNGKPWMWSQWVCDRRMSTATRRRRRCMSSSPKSRSPLPASRISRRDPGPVTLRQAVLPP
jgi:hypothetical protein